MIDAMRPFGRGVLWIVAALFLASAILRIVGGSGVARALGTEPIEVAPLGADHAPATGCVPSPEIAPLLEEISTRTDTLNAREERIAEREATLSMAESRVREDLAALAEAEASLRATMVRAETAAEDDLTRLTSVYENMKPREAAALFAQMAPDFAAGFLGRMRPDAAAAIFAGLEPKTAYAISVVLAGRNADAPTR